MFYGEFLSSPIPLDLSLNWCSHACAYCFANINAPGRTANIKQVMGLLSGIEERRSLEARLLRAGYPVLASNKVDLFAGSNYQQALPLLETMTELGIPVAFQTRGGKGIDEALAFLPPSCWYVSICQTDDAARKAIEPGAPPLEARWELIEKLRAKGHEVLLAINPLVPEWMPEPAAVFERAAKLGVWGVWMELLHFNKDQEAALRGGSDRKVALRPDAAEVLTESIIRRARARKRPEELRAFHEAAEMSALAAGLHPYHIGLDRPTRYWEPYRRLYPKTFPVMQDFVNWAFEALEPGQVVSFADYERVMIPRLPEPDRAFPIGNYIGAKKPALLRDNNYPNSMSYWQILAEGWKHLLKNFSLNPAGLGCFARAGTQDGDVAGPWTEYVDERGLQYLVFAPHGQVVSDGELAETGWIIEASDCFAEAA